MSKKKKSSRVEVYSNEETQEGQAQAVAKRMLEPAVQAAISIDMLDDTYDTAYITGELEKQIEAVHNGDMRRAESMLLAQSHSLNSLSSYMLRKACSAEYLNNLKVFANIALKAQNQCRMTLETLSEIKNPKPYIQNNKAKYQQINNNGQASRAGENSKTTNELLTDGSNDYEAMDTRGASKAGGIDKDMEAVGAKHRGKN